MDEDLTRHYQRWRDADAAARVDDADGACRAVFTGIAREPAVSSGFVAGTLAAIALATARDRARARRLRRASLVGSVAAAVAVLYVGGAWITSGLSAMLVGLLNLLVGATVQAATGVQTGLDVWSVLASLGRAAAAFVANPTVTIAMFAMQGIAMAALLALQRLLGSERESPK